MTRLLTALSALLQSVWDGVQPGISELWQLGANHPGSLIGVAGVLVILRWAYQEARYR